MIPTGVATVVAFFFFVAPGLLAEILLDRYRPNRTDTAFREASRVVLISAPFSIVGSVLVYCFVWWFVNPHWTNLLDTWAVAGKPPSGEAVLVLIGMAVAEVVMACFLAWQASDIWGDSLYPGSTISPENPWKLAMTPEEGFVTIATVTLSDGSQYQGKVATISSDLAWANREITLQPPITITREGVSKRLRADVVTLHSSSITAISATPMSYADFDLAATYPKLPKIIAL